MWCGRYVISHTNPQIIFNTFSTGKNGNGDKNKASIKVTKQIYNACMKNTHAQLVR